jgi:hypothetical protein
MSYSGFFLRDALGDTPTSPAGAWTNSPDIIPAGLQPLADPSEPVSQAGYARDEGQPVRDGSVNYIYVRALNTGGAATARIWLFYTDASLALWPQNWQYEGIQVAGAQANYVEIAANSANQIVLSSPPFQWTPARPRSHYCLIAIAENAPLSNPPTPPLPQQPFGTFDELAAFVQGNPNVGWRGVVDITGSAAP